MNRFSLMLLGLMLIAGGCSDYVGDYEYVPRPAIAQVPTTQPQSLPAVTEWATVEGVRRADRDAGIPLSVEVHLQLQNAAPEMLTFDPRSMVLTDGALMNFAPAVGVPVGPMTVPPGASVTLVAYFPFLGGASPDSTKMSPLQFRWVVQIGDQAFPQAVFFQQIFPYYYYYGPYGGYPTYPPVFITGTVVYVHHRH
jgi:hypothetical protein